uniref:Uncharacterized protein n=1 Tax=Panagrolaimus davidi TaxID=227884 RepID=A0A914RDJ3_9BILA
MRKTLIEEGLKCGFKNVEIIAEETAVYLQAMSQISYKPLNGNIIWIDDRRYYYVWQICDQKAKFIREWDAESYKLADLEKIVNESKTDKAPDIFLCRNGNDRIDKKHIFSPACRIFVYNYELVSLSQPSLLKALITAGDSKLAHLNVQNCLQDYYWLNFGNEELIKFKPGRELPIIYSQQLIKRTKDDMLKIVR